RVRRLLPRVAHRRPGRAGLPGQVLCAHLSGLQDRQRQPRDAAADRELERTGLGDGRAGGADALDRDPVGAPARQRGVGVRQRRPRHRGERGLLPVVVRAGALRSGILVRWRKRPSTRERYSSCQAPPSISPAAIARLTPNTRRCTAMAVKIRLKRFGKKRAPYYRIVVMDSRVKRDGRAIEEIGKYHPTEEPSLIEVNSERAQYWLSVGAQPTEQVEALLKLSGDWQKFKGDKNAQSTIKPQVGKLSPEEQIKATADAAEKLKAEKAAAKEK